MALIIGSTAMNKLFPETRKPKDLDVFARPHPEIGFYPDSSDSFWHDRLVGSSLDRDGYATLNELYTIKVSHAGWDIKNGSWSKHMSDILYLQDKGAKLDKELFDLLYSIWIDVHGAKKMNLQQESGAFFKDAVVRIYDHDSIHRSTARREYALYEMFLKDGKSVDMDMKKVWQAPHNIIVELFREEIAATALERYLIPTNYKFSPGRAWTLATKKTITSLTKGRSSLFLIENFREFMKPTDDIDDETYLQRHLKQKDRLIKLIGNEKGMM